VYGELDSIIQIVVLSIFATTALSTLLAYHKLMMSKGSPSLHLHLDLTYLLIFVCLIALALSFLLFHYIDTLNAVISDLNSLYSRYNTYISDHNLSKSPLTKFSTTYLGISLPATFAFVDIFLYSAIGIVLLLTILIYLKVGGR
jgi:TRAP-type C4-dicarboxylate transport system permease small subunit